MLPQPHLQGKSLQKKLLIVRMQYERQRKAALEADGRQHMQIHVCLMFERCKYVLNLNIYID